MKAKKAIEEKSDISGSQTPSYLKQFISRNRLRLNKNNQSYETALDYTPYEERKN